MKQAKTFLIAPDYRPAHTLDWYRFTGVLQKIFNKPLHLQLPRDGEEYQELLQKQPALVYAGAFEGAALIRNHGYLTAAKPLQRSDEVVIFTSSQSDIQDFSDLRQNIEVYCMADFDVEQISLLLLEAADISKSNTRWNSAGHFQTAVRKVRDNTGSIGIIRKEIYDSLSETVKSKYREIISSKLSEISHAFLISPEETGLAASFDKTLKNMKSDKNLQTILHSLGFEKGLEKMDQEEGLFMGDIIDTFTGK